MARLILVATILALLSACKTVPAGGGPHRAPVSPTGECYAEFSAIPVCIPL